MSNLSIIAAMPRDQVLGIMVVAWFGFNGVSAVRVLLQFRRMGRPNAAVLWFSVTVFCSALPYLIYATLVRAGWLMRGDTDDGHARPGRRCPHCSTLLSGPEAVRNEGGTETCVHCGMALKGNDIA